MLHILLLFGSQIKGSRRT